MHPLLDTKPQKKRTDGSKLVRDLDKLERANRALKIDIADLERIATLAVAAATAETPEEAAAALEELVDELIEQGRVRPPEDSEPAQKGGDGNG
jgi:hypothetical protein